MQALGERIVRVFGAVGDPIFGRKIPGFDVTTKRAGIFVVDPDQTILVVNAKLRVNEVGTTFVVNVLGTAVKPLTALPPIDQLLKKFMAGTEAAELPVKPLKPWPSRSSTADRKSVV